MCRSALPAARRERTFGGRVMARVPDRHFGDTDGRVVASVMPAGGELGESGTLDFSGVWRCSR